MGHKNAGGALHFMISRHHIECKHADFESGWGSKKEGESRASKGGVTELVFELLPHSNQHLQWHVLPLCAQTSSVTPPSEMSYVSTDPLSQYPPAGCGLPRFETRTVSIFLEIAPCPGKLLVAALASCVATSCRSKRYHITLATPR